MCVCCMCMCMCVWCVHVHVCVLGRLGLGVVSTGHPPVTHFWGEGRVLRESVGATCCTNTLHNLAPGRGERGEQDLCSVFTQGSGTDHIPSCHPFSFELPNCPDRTHCPFALPTGPEGSCTLGAGVPWMLAVAGPQPHLGTGDLEATLTCSRPTHARAPGAHGHHLCLLTCSRATRSG